MSDPEPESESAVFGPATSDRPELSLDDTWTHFLPDSDRKQHYTTRLSPPVAAEVEAFRERYDLAKAEAIAILVQLGLGHTSTIARLDRLATTVGRTNDRYDQLATSVTRLEQRLDEVADTLAESTVDHDGSSAIASEARGDSASVDGTSSDGTVDDPDELF